MRAFITINYDDGDPDTYKSVEVSDINDVRKIFDSGCFVKDWFYAIKHILVDIQPEIILESSSVDHFIMDGDPYDSGYIRFDDNGKPYLGYEYSHEDGGTEIFVENGDRPTWDELKEKYK